MPTPLPIIAWKKLKKIGRLWHPEIFLEKMELVGCLGNGQSLFLMFFSNGACAKAY